VLHTDHRFSQAVEAAVTEIEVRTDAEVVVVAAAASGSYRDVCLLVGAVAAWATLAFVLYTPWHFEGTWLAVELPIVMALFTFAAGRSPTLVRRLTSRARREAQVQAAARAAFLEESVHGTPRRNAVLVYVSALEDTVVVLPDSGLLATMPLAEVNGLRFGAGPDPRAPGDLDHFVSGLRALGEVLHRHAPPVVGDNVDTIPNAPRIRS